MVKLLDREITQYQQQGWVKIPAAFDPKIFNTVKQDTVEIIKHANSYMAQNPLKVWGTFANTGYNRALTRSYETKTLKEFCDVMDQKNLQISKIEQFVGVHPSVDDFLKNILPRYVGQIIFDPVFVREKIIEKYPSEKLVYSVHNDLPALYTTVASSVCVAYLSLDRTNKDNGCLYMQNQPVTTRPCIECQCFNGAPCQCQGYSGQSAIPENKIDIQADLRDADLSTNWVEVTTEPGDLVLFDGLTPHYSTRNIDGSPRRYLYGVYAPSGNIRPEIDANDLRNEWYRWFRDHLSEHRHAWANI